MIGQPDWHPLLLDYIAAHPVPVNTLLPDLGRYLAPITTRRAHPMTERERAAIEAARRLLAVLETISGPPMRLAIARDELRAALAALDPNPTGGEP